MLFLYEMRIGNSHIFGNFRMAGPYARPDTHGDFISDFVNNFFMTRWPSWILNAMTRIRRIFVIVAPQIFGSYLA